MISSSSSICFKSFIHRYCNNNIPVQFKKNNNFYRRNILWTRYQGFRTRSGTATRLNTGKNKLKKTDKEKLYQDQKSENHIHGDLFPPPIRSTIKYGAYSIALTGFIFGECAIWQYSNNMKSRDMEPIRPWEEFKRDIDGKAMEIRQAINEIWNHLPKMQKFTLGIIGCNILIWGSWKIFSRSIMTRWFALSALKSNSAYLPLIFSNFSHHSLLHLGINMYILMSFSRHWEHLPTKLECVAPERFIAFYTSAGIAGCYLSLVIKMFSRNIMPSLGASAAIMGVIGYFCVKEPDSLLSIIFIPNWSFTAGSALKFIIGFDMCGILLGALTNWRYYVLDHAGHLGGMLFGLWYAKYGENILNKFSKKVMIEYHKTQEKD